MFYEEIWIECGKLECFPVILVKVKCLDFTEINFAEELYRAEDIRENCVGQKNIKHKY